MLALTGQFDDNNSRDSRVEDKPPAAAVSQRRDRIPRTRRITYMRAVGYFAPGPIAAPDSLRDIELPRPSATGRDLLVEVHAVSVNPVDYKVRASAPAPEGAAKVIGWDAAGIVVEAGPQATLFNVGDEVFYAGSIARPGTNAQFHLVDERI